MTIFRCTF